MKSKEVQEIFKKWVVSENKTYETWENKLKNQKNLKLKDYLRLTSLSNESRYKKAREFQRRESQYKNNKDKSRTRDTMKYSTKNERNIIDSQVSINLIKNSINQKLRRILKQSEEIMKSLDEKELVGYEYEDLVFMCNIHKAFDQNLFQSTRIIKEIFMEYKRKRKLTTMSSEPDFVEKVIKTILKGAVASSPAKKKKDDSNIMSPENIALELLQLIPQK